MKLSTQTIVITGLGGQGIVRFIQILGDALMNKGFTVMTSETHGLSQRGGKVKCFLRYGNKLTSPIPLNHSAEIIIALEKSCILDVLEYAKLNKRTRLIIAEYKKLLKSQTYPTDDYLKHVLSAYSKKIFYLDISKVKHDMIFLNTFILGFMLLFLPLEYENLKTSIEKLFSKENLEKNLRVLHNGFELARRESEKK
jgi:indolepyruvate ferredoxin oxidoreductase, beta subunit